MKEVASRNLRKYHFHAKPWGSLSRDTTFRLYTVTTAPSLGLILEAFRNRLIRVLPIETFYRFYISNGRVRFLIHLVLSYLLY